MPDPAARIQRYFATTRVHVSAARTSARLQRLHTHVRHLRALNAAHFPAAEAAERAKREAAARRAAREAKAQLQRDAELVRDPKRAQHLAMTVRALKHMQEYFTGGLEGGIFTTRSARLLAETCAAGKNDHNGRKVAGNASDGESDGDQHPLFFVLESLNFAYLNPELLRALPSLRPDVVAQAHHLPATDDAHARLQR